MELLDVYKKNPCGVLSIPYWKDKSITIPSNMRIVHDRDFSKSEYQEYKDEPYFRLFHSLKDIKTVMLDDVDVVTAKREDIPHFVELGFDAGENAKKSMVTTELSLEIRNVVPLVGPP